MAAAFAALVSLQNNLRLVRTHPTHSFSFEEEQIESLWETVSFLIKFMKSYDNSHGATKEAAEALEIRIARAAQAAEDVMESHIVDQIRSGKTRSPRFLLDLQKVIQDMDYMRRKATNVKAQSGINEADSAAEVISSTPHMASKKSSMVGFDDVLRQLLDQLTGFPSSRRVIPIIGMGGIGKTTLATNAFQHPLTVHHFDVCLWATISQQYSVQKILTQLVSCLRKSIRKSVDESSSCETVDVIRDELYKSLFGRRYLIILDDMWSLEAWYDIKNLFPDTQDGSRIVVTTRHADVGNHLGVPHLAIGFLDEENSWDLFCQKAFAEQGCPSELEELGKMIVEKCKGLPLAIVVVGGHLRKSSMTQEYWENVAHHMNSILEYSTENDEQCLNVLSLSYSYLPARLKPCFLFLGVFPEDEQIYVPDVLKFWIAEGFIESSNNTRLDEAGRYYIRDLSERNLILVDGWDYNGEVCMIKVHDLVRELCLKIAKTEEFLSVLDTPQAINRERRVVISGEIPETKTFDAPIRCLICEGGRLSHDLKLLRTVHEVAASSTTDSIFQQLNLRYLKVDIDQKSRPSVYLPSSISLLWNLQILRIWVPTHSTVIAPYEIWEMVQLRYFEVYPVCLVDPLPVDRLDQANDLVLRNLHTLSIVENLRFSEEVCKRIPHVREMHLSYCDEASSSYCPSNLGNFHELEYLLLKFDGNSKWHDFCLSLTFPNSLKWLYLSGCGVDWDELTIMVGSLPNLVCLKLCQNAVIGSVWSPIEGKFRRLRQLVILGCDDLIYWNAENFHFPVLRSLLLRNLPKLEKFPSGIGEIPTLALIQMEFCSESSSISAMTTLVEQEEQGNEDLKLQVLFRGDEKTIESFGKKVREKGLQSKNLSLYCQNVKTKSF